MRNTLTLISILAAVAMSLSAAAPAVTNRAPAADDIGYLPADGAIVGTNPPALAWLPERDAAAYAVQFARDAAFTQGVLTIPTTPYVLYTHTAAMSPGTWWWRYACLDAAGERSGWSQARKFTIAPDAQPFPRPGDNLVRERMPARHPRLMLRPEEVEVFRQARLGAQKERWEALVQTAEQYLKTPLIPEPPPWTGGQWTADEWRANYQKGIRASEIAETLAFCYLLSGDARYGEGARKWLLHIATWNPAGTTSMRVNDEAGMPILHVTSRAYDWVYNYLSDDDRAKLQAMIRARGEEAYNILRRRPHEQKAYDSHAGRMWHFMGEAAIAYYGEVPEAKKWLDYALTMFWGWYPAYGDEDGGWAQGYSYWASYVTRSTWWLDALKAALGIDGTDKPFYRNVGQFPLYVGPPGGALVGFGDYDEARPNAGPAATVAYFARARGVPEWQWYAEAWGREDSASDPVGFLRATRPNPPAVSAKPPVDWPKARIFRGAGWVSLHTNLLDGAKDVQVMMRSAPLGNQSHSHADQNAFVLGAYGSPLLVNTGLRPWYGSPFCKEWYWTTKAHNALEIDGKGQPKTVAATGNIIVFRPGESYDYVVGDAPSGYGPDILRYRRHLVFLKPDILVVVDEVQAAKPVSLKFWIHGRAPFTIAGDGGDVSLAYENAVMAGFLRSPGGLDTVQTDKYTIPPEMGKTQPEWHVAAETKQKQADARFIAVFGVARAGEKVALDGVEDVSSGKTIAVRFRRSGKPVTVSLDTVSLVASVQ